MFATPGCQCVGCAFFHFHPAIVPAKKQSNRGVKNPKNREKLIPPPK
jgi:hypothetical protein